MQPPPPSPIREFFTVALQNRSFVLGGTISLAILCFALIALMWTPYNITEIDVANKFQWPNQHHWLGTDHIGRDVLSRLMAGSVNSILIAMGAVALGMGIGIPLGAAAAASQSVYSEAIMRANDFIFAFPALLIAMLLTAIYGPSALNAVLAIGIFNIPVFARLAHGSMMALWQREFILSARASGKSSTRITVEHIIPNIANVLIVQGTIQFSLGILIEAGLSYVGLGTQPPLPSWGKMLADAQTMMGFAPYLAIFPGLAIVITVLGLNLLGDGLRDSLDPKLRRRR